MKIISVITFAIVAFFAWSALTMMSPSLPFSPVTAAIIGGLVGLILAK